MAEKEFIPYAELDEEQKAMVDSEDGDDRWEAARSGWGLDNLKNDPEWLVRKAVAGQGYALFELKNDPHWMVREAVAKQGHALDELKNDPHWVVREAVANQGYALDGLKSDQAWQVRHAVAKQGHALDELKNDPEWKVRFAVAWQGHALDELKNDLDEGVREAVANYLQENNLTLEEWIAANPDKCGLEENRNWEAKVKGEGIDGLRAYALKMAPNIRREVNKHLDAIATEMEGLKIQNTDMRAILTKTYGFAKPFETPISAADNIADVLDRYAKEVIITDYPSLAEFPIAEDAEVYHRTWNGHAEFVAFFENEHVSNWVVGVMEPNTGDIAWELAPMKADAAGVLNDLETVALNRAMAKSPHVVEAMQKRVDELTVENSPRAMTPPGADKPAHAEKATVGKDASDMKANRKAGYEGVNRARNKSV